MYNGMNPLEFDKTSVARSQTVGNSKFGKILIDP